MTKQEKLEWLNDRAREFGMYPVFHVCEVSGNGPFAGKAKLTQPEVLLLLAMVWAMVAAGDA
jgi:hypothetical protein